MKTIYKIHVSRKSSHACVHIVTSVEVSCGALHELEMEVDDEFEKVNLIEDVVFYLRE